MRPVHRRTFTGAALALALTLLVPASASAQTGGRFKVAFYNIQSGKGEPPLPGRLSTFADTTNCTDPTQPLNAWGVGVVQRELRDRIGADPAIVAMGMDEAWTCGSPAHVAGVLGWKATSERNGVGLVARYGFAGPEEWRQLDTSLNDNQKDLMWVLRTPVCLDGTCSAWVFVAVTHWYASQDSQWATTTYERQAEGTVAFLAESPEPQVLVGDLNVWESPLAMVCGQPPIDAGLDRLRAAGYTDAWPHLYQDAEGFTGMLNRPNCGTPEGYAWKRLDYAWSSPGYTPVSMKRFGLVPAGEEAPSDHYGIIAEYQRGNVESPAAGQLGPGDAIIYAAQATRISGGWRVISDSTAAAGKAIENPDLGAAKRTAALASPADFFEATFTAEGGRAYRLWVRGKASGNAWSNDSVFVQFSGTVSSAGEPMWRIGTTNATAVGIEECSGCGLAGWGWADNGYGTLGPLVYFASTGTQTIRVQQREDGITIDQILLSPEMYLSTPPGLPKNDTTIFSRPSPRLEVVRYASDLTTIAGDWVRVIDPSAAGGSAIRNPDRGAAKLTSALAAPASYIELTVDVEAQRAYRLWLRGRAEKNAWTNDSAYVQFSGAVTGTGAPAWPIGTSSATWVGIEDCSGCGLSGWGWQDNGYGLGVLGPLVYFGTSGPHTIRIQQREDGLVIDQIVLSAERYLTTPPGLTKNDTTILPR
jgi:exonuclease III